MSPATDSSGPENSELANAESENVLAPIRYESTRGRAPSLEFADVLLTGLAPDGGLYCPTTLPPLPAVNPEATYAELAAELMWPFVFGSIERPLFNQLVAESYQVFRRPEVCPLVELGPDHFMLDLAKGPTLAFKDVALQLLGRLLDAELSKRGQRVTVLGATSGDTGSAAISALENLETVEVVILHPAGRVSEVQRRQMTTVDAPNVHNVAIRGTFDDCQDLVKAAFADESLRDKFQLAAVNSINWARVMAQIVYYVWAARKLLPSGGPVSFAVPTGNFGNVLAGWYATQMGLAVNNLVVASNRNDILARYFETGSLSSKPVQPSLSPSMDIAVSSNFERLLWEASGRQGSEIEGLLAAFRANGVVEVPAVWSAGLGGNFVGGRLSDEETLAEISRIYSEAGLVVDPHTAVAAGLANRMISSGELEGPVVTLATADAAKFPDAVESAVGSRPALPDFLADLYDRKERLVEADASLDSVAAVLAGL